MPREVEADLEADAYQDVSTADDIAETHPNGASWIALDDDDRKARLLALASRDIDTLEDDPGFLGDRASDDQELEWPRTSTSYSDDAWPQRLVDATTELAFDYAAKVANDEPVLSEDPRAAGVVEETVGPITTKWEKGTASAATAIERFPAVVQRLLNGLLRSSTAGSWGSSTAYRGS